MASNVTDIGHPEITMQKIGNFAGSPIFYEKTGFS
jgi:hypothetical protein